MAMGHVMLCSCAWVQVSPRRQLPWYQKKQICFGVTWGSGGGDMVSGVSEIGLGVILDDWDVEDPERTWVEVEDV
jgi:hypothetical protein